MNVLQLFCHKDGITHILRKSFCVSTYSLFMHKTLSRWIMEWGWLFFSGFVGRLFPQLVLFVKFRQEHGFGTRVDGPQSRFRWLRWWPFDDLEAITDKAFDLAKGSFEIDGRHRETQRQRRSNYFFCWKLRHFLQIGRQCSRRRVRRMERLSSHSNQFPLLLRRSLLLFIERAKNRSLHPRGSPRWGLDRWRKTVLLSTRKQPWSAQHTPQPFKP